MYKVKIPILMTHCLIIGKKTFFHCLVVCRGIFFTYQNRKKVGKHCFRHFPEHFCFWSLVPLRTPELSLTSRSPTDILVSWQPLPPKLSRGRVSAYRLSYRTATDEQVISVELPVPSENCTQYLLQALQPDTIYLIRMSASTRVGWSQPSAWNSHRTPKTSSATGETTIYLHLARNYLFCDATPSKRWRVFAGMP